MLTLDKNTMIKKQKNRQYGKDVSGDVNGGMITGYKRRFDG